MAAHPPKTGALQGAQRAELARLCRQICLAREQGSMSPMTAEDEFVMALATVRATYGPRSVNEDDLREIVAIEESRVADATVIAGLLAKRLLAAAQNAASAGSSSPKPPATPNPFPNVYSGSPFSVADLVDGLLPPKQRDVRTPGAA